MPDVHLIEHILVQRGVLRADQLAAVQAEQRAGSPGPVEAAVRLGLATEDRAYAAVAAHFGLPFVDVAHARVDADAIARLTLPWLREFHLLPLARNGPVLPIAVGDVAQLGRVDEVGMILDTAVRAVLAVGPRLDAVLDRLAQPPPEPVAAPPVAAAAPETARTADAGSDAPVIKLATLILTDATNQGASDVHIEPYEDDLVVRYRVDGLLRPGLPPPPQHRQALISRFKVMAGLDIAERRLPQDGRIMVQLSRKKYDIRVAILPGLHGESVVMRILDSSTIQYKLEELGFSAAMMPTLTQLIEQDHGLVLVTGPTGSGKTTTLYACLSRLKQPEYKIFTVEDPVEYQLKGVVQIQTHAAIGLTFASALRSLLRQDPDIMMVGEMRDLETASIGMQAALTGHLVFSTLHTNDAPSATTRLVDMGVAPYLIASCVRGVLAQRLARRICSACKESYQPSREELIRLFPGQPDHEVALLHRGRGCDSCRGSGFRGRIGVYELLVMDDEMRRLLMQGAPASEIRRVALAHGMISLFADAQAKVLAGLTTVDEALRTTQAGD